jgi:hypothetical protein
MSGGREELSEDMLALLRSMGLASAAGSDARALLPNGDPARAPERVHALGASAPGAEALAALARDGVVRLDNVLSAALCQAAGVAICEALRRHVAAGRDAYSNSRDTPFGNVDEPGKRWDMYLDYHGTDGTGTGAARTADGGEVAESVEAATAAGRTYRSALAALLGAPSAPLRELFDALFDGADAAFYELAALVSDAGAASQRVHSDTVMQPSCPLYTCFVALQDTDMAMGCTHFIKGSHTSEAHHSLRHTRGDYLAAADYSAATLSRGDAVVMDSRLFHFGGANDARRRKLLYFTLQNPAFASAPGVGSKLDSLHLNLHDIGPPACA